MARATSSEPGRSQSELVRFYDVAYSSQGAEADRSARWRALSAISKADHVVTLCDRGGLKPATTLEVGCGDGALLSELHRRGFGGRLRGLEITEAAADIAAQRPGIDAVAIYDGQRLPGDAGEQDLGIVSHVLEHVPEPGRLLAEVARVCKAVVVEVPLERNLSAARPGKRAHAGEIGHLQALSRESMRGIVRDAGLQVSVELEDPLPLAVHAFFARDSGARARATVKWLTRSVAHRGAPALARRLFTVHYACLCLPSG
jgi:SAM-dependent methyltransferase